MLSIIIPVYNEEERIGRSLEAIISFFKNREDLEILVVDDGSTDKTMAVLKAFDANLVKVITYSKNKGKGYAVKQGLLQAKGAFVLLTDSDLSTPVEEYEKLKHVSNDNTLVIGSRALADSTVNREWYKNMLGRLGNAFIQRLLPGIQDTQCGFKLFPQEAIRKIAPLMSINGFGYDFEMLFLAKELGYSIVEVPVKWYNMEGSKVRFYHYATTLLELFKVMSNKRKGKYGIKKGASI